MKRVIEFMIMSVLLLLVTGCGLGQETAVPTIEGPALVLFYTDG